MTDWHWFVAWVVAVGVLGYALPRVPSPWNWIVAVIFVTVAGLGSVAFLFAVILMLN